VAKHWRFKKLGLDLDSAIALARQVATQIAGDRQKERATFYYLVAKHAGKIESL
jgi:hypothetical protein